MSWCYLSVVSLCYPQCVLALSSSRLAGVNQLIPPRLKSAGLWQLLQLKTPGAGFQCKPIAASHWLISCHQLAWQELIWLREHKEVFSSVFSLLQLPNVLEGLATGLATAFIREYGALCFRKGNTCQYMYFLHLILNKIQLL